MALVCLSSLICVLAGREMAPDLCSGAGAESQLVYHPSEQAGKERARSVHVEVWPAQGQAGATGDLMRTSVA